MGKDEDAEMLTIVGACWDGVGEHRCGDMHVACGRARVSRPTADSAVTVRVCVRLVSPHGIRVLERNLWWSHLESVRKNGLIL